MRPFVTYEDDKMRWNYQPRGRNRYRVDLWAKIIDGSVEEISINPKSPCTITELMPTLIENMDELLMGRTDIVDYGFRAYVWG